jgi:osmotically-inducible protein OsmY
MQKYIKKIIAIVLSIFPGIIGAPSTIQMRDRIESSAKKSYVFMTYLKDDTIIIATTNDSIVTLTGTVSERVHRSMAEETVAALPGVVHVNNRLEIKGEQNGDTTDAWIGLKVKTMLLFHRDLSGLNTEVDVKDRVVSLHGQASSMAQKELTTEFVRDVDGVKSVKNDLNVETNEKTTLEKVGVYIDDASITTQVKLALLFHQSTSVIKTKVETNKGKVTVSGIARNSAERALVDKLVTNIKGVKSINNQITVEKTPAK